MSQATGIEWTDATWNPVRGCSRVSEGCRNCYAEKVAYRFSGPGQPYEGLVHLAGGENPLGLRIPKWNGQIKFVEEHLLGPLKWRKSQRVFVNSMSDLFHEGVTDEQLDCIFAVMALCPQHTFQVLTKRPERMVKYFAAGQVRDVKVAAAAKRSSHTLVRPFALPSERIFDARRIARNEPWEFVQWPLPNVWLGVSVEDQKAADARLPLLLQTPAAVRFISAEPLLGPITFRPRCNSLADKLHAMEHGYAGKPMELIGIDWVICGGESGPGARPMHPDWARGLRDQCAAAGVPFFFKQWGAWIDGSDFRDSARIVLNDGRVVEGDPGDLSQDDRNRWADFNATMMAPVGKKAAGRLLDGREWNGFPAVPA